MELKLWFSFLLFYVFPDVVLAQSRWLIDVPSKITAVQGSCAVIPCEYAFPKTKKDTRRKIGVWRTGNKVVSTSLSEWKLKPAYKKRTRFLGNIHFGNCTMMLDGIRTTDVGPFYFRIEMPRYKSFTFSENTVSIDVLRSPPPPSLSVKVDSTVTAYCSVSHICPMVPPHFSWTRNGYNKRKTTKVNKWLWTMESVLTFIPSATDFDNPLNCTVHYRDKKAVSSVMLPSGI